MQGIFWFHLTPREEYWGTGAYLVLAQFNPDVQDDLPFWKHINIDKERGNAKLACRDTWEQMEENLEKGKTLRFCCGKTEGFPTCCCGGWTHELVRISPIFLYTHRSYSLDAQSTPEPKTGR